MPDILYILGAGASANVLPMINSSKDENGITRLSLIEELIVFADKVSSFDGYQIYLELCRESKDFSTPDTFAKFLYISNRDTDYLKFKTILSSYFFLERKHSKH